MAALSFRHAVREDSLPIAKRTSGTMNRQYLKRNKMANPPGTKPQYALTPYVTLSTM